MADTIYPGTAGPGDVSNLKTFSGGVYYNAQGQLVDRRGAGVVLTPGPSDIAVPSGIFGGVVTDGKVAAVAFDPSKVLNDTTIAGTKGTMPPKSAQTYTPTTTNQTISAGQYLSGNQTILGDPNLLAQYILSGVSIFGVAGTAINGAGMKYYAYGNTLINSSSGAASVSGLSFTPTTLIATGYCGSSQGQVSVAYSTDNAFVDNIPYPIDGGNYWYRSASAFALATGVTFVSGGFNFAVYPFSPSNTNYTIHYACFG